MTIPTKKRRRIAVDELDQRDEQAVELFAECLGLTDPFACIENLPDSDVPDLGCKDTDEESLFWTSDEPPSPLDRLSDSDIDFIHLDWSSGEEAAKPPKATDSI